MSEIDKRLISITLVLILILGNIMPIFSYASEATSEQEDNIQFENEDLKKLLLNSYDKNGDGEISKEEILSVDYLYLTGINNLKGLEYATNLMGITLENCEELTEIPNFAKIESINIRGEKVTSLPNLNNIENTNNRNIYLSIGDTSIETFDGQNKLANITSLNLMNNAKIKNITLPKNIKQFDIYESKLLSEINFGICSKLERINISKNTTVNIKNIDNLTELQNISLCNVSDIKSLGSSNYVKTLNLTGNEITSMPDISGLTNLSSVSIQDTSIINLSNIAGLRSVDLYNNEKMEKILQPNDLEYITVSGEKTSKLPDLSECPKLTSVNLQYTGNIDISSLNNAKQITYLYIYGGDGMEEIPKLDYITNISISNYQKLPTIVAPEKIKYISISNCQITNLTAIKNLSNLNTLNLSDNSTLTDISAIENLQNITNLSLYKNEKISDISVIEKLKNMTYLSISGDSGIRDFSIPDGLENLSNLNLSNTVIETISLPNAYKLNNISLYNNDELKKISNIPNLRTISIEGNNITKFPDFENLDNLTNINIYGTKINKITNNPGVTGLSVRDNDTIEEISNMENLNALTISSCNNLKKISEIDKLQYLSIDSISSENLNMIGNINELTTLELRNNENMTDISKIADMPNLSYLEISSCPVEDLSAIANLTKLEELTLNNTNVRQIPKCDSLNSVTLSENEYLKDMGDASNLTSIRIDGTNSEMIEKISKMYKLETIEISGSSITQLPNLSALTKLNDVYLYGNENLTDISNLSGAQNLASLEFYNNNNIQNFDVLNKLTKLKYLTISENGFNNTECLKNMNNLKDLSIKNTGVESLEGLSNLPKLEELYIENNSSLQKIENINNLCSLDINGCNIEEINNLPNLYNLNIAGQENLPKLTNLENVIHMRLEEVETPNLNEITKLTNLEGISIFRDSKLTDISAFKFLKHLINVSMDGVPDEILKQFYEINEKCVGVKGTTINIGNLFKYGPIYMSKKAKIKIEDTNIAKEIELSEYGNNYIYLNDTGTTNCEITVVNGNNGEIKTLNTTIEVIDANTDELEKDKTIDAKVVGRDAVLTASGELWKTSKDKKETIRKESSVKKYISNDVYRYKNINYEFILKNDNTLEFNIEDKQKQIDNIKDISDVGYVTENGDYYLINSDGTFTKTLSDVKEISGIFVVKNDGFTYNAYGSKISESKLKETRFINEQTSFNSITGLAGFEDGTLYANTMCLDCDLEADNPQKLYGDENHNWKAADDYKKLMNYDGFYITTNDEVKYYANYPREKITNKDFKYYKCNNNIISIDESGNLYINDIKIMESVQDAKENGNYDLTILRKDGTIYNLNTSGTSGITKLGNIEPQKYHIGDIDGDEKINIKDWNRLNEYINETITLSTEELQRADVNGDGKVNIKDWNRLYDHITEVNPIE